MWRMDEGKRGAAAPRQGSGRGLAYWTDGKGDERIVTVTPGYHMVAAQREDRHSRRRRSAGTASSI